MRVQRFHFTHHDQVIASSVFGVNLAVEPVQATGNDRVTQRRHLPIDTLPLVCAFTGKPVGYADLFTREDIDCESARATNTGITGRTGHHAE
ncbi:hypothetical protein D3C76_1369180 [compost metagenome]